VFEPDQSINYVHVDEDETAIFLFLNGLHNRAGGMISTFK
jgi:hypothetical protein